MTSTTGGLCQALTVAGEPCQAQAQAGSGWCFWHDPSKAQERQDARARGGRARHGRTLARTGTDVKLACVADVVTLLGQVAQDLYDLENSLGRARALCQVASVAVKALEVAELEERLTRLEAKVGL
jgi:hypothetical protein